MKIATLKLTSVLHKDSYRFLIVGRRGDQRYVNMVLPGGVHEALSNVFQGKAMEAELALDECDNAAECIKVVDTYIPRVLSGPKVGHAAYLVHIYDARREAGLEPK